MDVAARIERRAAMVKSSGVQLVVETRPVAVSELDNGSEHDAELSGGKSGASSNAPSGTDAP